jgi:hypothetical protein
MGMSIVTEPSLLGIIPCLNVFLPHSSGVAIKNLIFLFIDLKWLK